MVGNGSRRGTVHVTDSLASSLTNELNTPSADGGEVQTAAAASSGPTDWEAYVCIESTC